MALKKEIILEKGIVANYFRIASITQNFINQDPILDVYIYGYANENYRNEEKEIADDDIQKVVSFNNYRLLMDDEKGYSREDIYNRIKSEIPEFDGAEDC